MLTTLPRTLRRLAWLPLALGLAPGAADASAIRYDYTGVVTTAGANSGEAVGDTFSGSFTIDPARVTGSVNDLVATTSYQLTGASGLELSDHVVGTSSGAMNLSVTDHNHSNYVPETLSTQVQVTTLSGGYGPTATLSFTNPNRSVFHGSLAIPALLQLSDFPVATLNYTDGNVHNDPSYSFTGTIDTLTATPVPEPAVTVSACLALVVGLAARRRRRARLEGNGRPC